MTPFVLSRILSWLVSISHTALNAVRTLSAAASGLSVSLHARRLFGFDALAACGATKLITYHFITGLERYQSS